MGESTSESPDAIKITNNSFEDLKIVNGSALTDAEGKTDATADSKTAADTAFEIANKMGLGFLLASANSDPVAELEKLGYGGGPGKPLTSKEVLDLRGAKKDPTHPAHKPALALHNQLHDHNHNHKHHHFHGHHGHEHHGINMDHMIAEMLGLVPVSVMDMVHGMHMPDFSFLHLDGLQGKPLPGFTKIEVKPVKHKPNCKNHPVNKLKAKIKAIEAISDPKPDPMTVHAHNVLHGAS